jgi:hypothetical protein
MTITFSQHVFIYGNSIIFIAGGHALIFFGDKRLFFSDTDGNLFFGTFCTLERFTSSGFGYAGASSSCVD